MSKYVILNNDDTSMLFTESFRLSSSSSYESILSVDSSPFSRQRSSGSICSDNSMTNVVNPSPLPLSTSPSSSRYHRYNRGSSCPSSTQATTSSSSSTPSQNGFRWPWHKSSAQDENQSSSKSAHKRKSRSVSQSEISILTENSVKTPQIGSSSIGKALSTCASTFIAAPYTFPTSTPEPTPNEMRVAIRDGLRNQLINKAGPSKSNNLYKRHVEKSHFLLINADEDADDEMVVKIRRLIKERPNPLRITGRWDIPLGAERLTVWQHLIESATTVLVILSRALCRDKILTLCFPEALIRDQAIVPLYLEPFTDEEVEREIPPALRPVVLNCGKILYDDQRCNIESYIDRLHKSFDYETHYGQEIEALESLIDNYKKNPNYECACRNC